MKKVNGMLVVFSICFLLIGISFAFPLIKDCISSKSADSELKEQRIQLQEEFQELYEKCSSLQKQLNTYSMYYGIPDKAYQLAELQNSYKESEPTDLTCKTIEKLFTSEVNGIYDAWYTFAGTWTPVEMWYSEITPRILLLCTDNEDTIYAWAIVEWSKIDLFTSLDYGVFNFAIEAQMEAEYAGGDI